MKSLLCEICGARPAYRHHIISRGSGGSDSPKNILAVCFRHHCEIHTIGCKSAAKKYNLVARFDAARKSEKEKF
jgi:hypothetical protein